MEATLETSLRHVTSNDGTRIAYERHGQGPALILVDGALCSRAFGPMPNLAKLLERDFTVYVYDRRGRGDSGDTPPYAKQREVEDLGALIREAGGAAFALGLSSGGALALEAAACGLPITKVAAYEPPYVNDGGDAAAAGHEARLREILREGRRGDAVKYFMRDMVGAPAFMVMVMRLMPGPWAKLTAVAHTLPHDAANMGDFRVPGARLADVGGPAWIGHGAKTDARLARAAEGVARSLPNAVREVLPGQTHNVDPKVLAPRVTEFFLGRRSAS